MAGILTAMMGGRKIAPITVSANWGFDSTAAPGPVISNTRTITVPIGNPGNLTLTPGGGLSAFYRLNGGSPVLISGPTPLPVANGDGLSFQSSTGAAFDGVSVAVDDATVATGVGSWNGSLTP
jgi:hypothetical protein